MHYSNSSNRYLKCIPKVESMYAKKPIWLQIITILYDICQFYKENIAENIKFITNYLFLSGKNINFALANFFGDGC